MEIYCSTCRSYFRASSSETNPPYSAVHTVSEEPKHRHPITGEVLEAA